MDSTDDPALTDVDRVQREHVYGDPRAHEVCEDKPRLQDLLVEDPRWGQAPASPTGEEGSAFQGPPLRPLRFYDSKNDAAKREALRDAELKRMEELYARIEKGIEEGAVDLESGAKMLLNVSAARMALGGVGHVYPGAW